MAASMLSSGRARLFAGLALGLLLAGHAAAQAYIGPIATPQTIDVNPGGPPVPSEKVDPTRPSIYYGDPAHANISGFWLPARGPRPYYYALGKAMPTKGADNQQAGFPYVPAWEKVLADRYGAEVTNMPYGDPSASCWPQGVYHNYIGYGSPVEITQTPGMLHIVNERMTASRHVYLDGRLHQANFTPTSEGDSIGHWEGDTLVVDTINMRPEFTWGYHQPKSSQAHMIERFRRLDAETLAIYFNLYDPVALTTPVETVLYFKLGAPGTKFTEDFCVENNRNEPDENLIVKVDIGPRRHYGFDLPEDK